MPRHIRDLGSFGQVRLAQLADYLIGACLRRAVVMISVRPASWATGSDHG